MKENMVSSMVPNTEQAFLFTAGEKDSWICMYAINTKSLLEAERQGGEGIDAFKSMFPTNEDPEEVKKRLIYSVYSLELEMKLLQLGSSEENILKGEIPINFLEYVLAAIGCFLSVKELQMMLDDIMFENQYMHNGKKTSLNCVEIVKLYVNYRPQEPLTKAKISQAFKDVLLLEGDSEKISRSSFMDIIAKRGDALSEEEFIGYVKCLRNVKSSVPSTDESTDFSEDEIPEEDFTINGQDKETMILNEGTGKTSEIRKILSEFITEDVFLRDILCIEQRDEDLSAYILKREDYKLVEQCPTLEDFVQVIQESNLCEDPEKF